jgi:hypothetical protein
LHYNTVCNYCNHTIQGMRWKCTFCDDYDLCQDCKSSSFYDHPNNHIFQPIAYPENDSDDDSNDDFNDDSGTLLLSF